MTRVEAEVPRSTSRARTMAIASAACPNGGANRRDPRSSEGPAVRAVKRLLVVGIRIVVGLHSIPGCVEAGDGPPATSRLRAPPWSA